METNLFINVQPAITPGMGFYEAKKCFKTAIKAQEGYLGGSNGYFKVPMAATYLERQCW
jgi:hypothetical protein